jgi:hypothetical protein
MQKSMIVQYKSIPLYRKVGQYNEKLYFYAEIHDSAIQINTFRLKSMSQEHNQIDS